MKPRWFLTNVLISPDLRRRFPAPDRAQLEHAIDDAVREMDPFAQLNPNYDGDAAKRQVEAALATHGARLPRPDESTWYEAGASHA